MPGGFLYTPPHRLTELRLADAAATLDPNSILSTPVDEVGNGALRFQIKTSVGPHTTPTAGAAVVWRAADLLDGQPTEAAVWAMVSEMYLMARPSLSSGVVVAVGVCTSAALAQYIETGLWADSGAMKLRYNIDATASTSTTGINTSGGDFDVTRARQSIGIGYGGAYVGPSDRGDTSYSLRWGSHSIARNDGRRFTDGVSTLSKEYRLNDVYVYVAVSLAAATTQAETVVVAARHGVIASDTNAWEPRLDDGLPVLYVGDSVLAYAYASFVQKGSRGLTSEMCAASGLRITQVGAFLDDIGIGRSSAVGGEKVADALSNAAARIALTDRAPRAIIHLLGINDASAPTSAPAFAASYQALIDAYEAAYPGVPQFPCIPPELANATHDTTLQGYTASINALTGVESVIDLRTGYDVATMSGDGVHPNEAGNVFIAGKFTTALTGL